MQETRLNGRYVLLEKLGEGGVALVYRAQDTLLDRTVAIKILRPQLTGDPVFLNRFRGEAQAAARLSHPNITAIYDVGQDGDQHYIVMEQVEGQDLKAFITANAPLSASVALGIAEQVCAALAHAHQQGFVHRDIKPQNILASATGERGAGVPSVKVADFGLARSLSAATSSEGGIVLGTVQYTSPEQARGEPATPASDIYALGVVLYEMLTGRLPFESDTPVGLALKHIQEAPLSPSRLNPRLPPTLDAFVLRAMAKQPAQRFASAAEMGATLAAYRQFGDQATGSMPVVRPATPATRPAPTSADRPAPPPAARAPMRQARVQKRGGFDWLLLILFLITFIAIAGLVPLAAAVRDAVFPPSPTPLPQVSVPNLIGLEQAIAESQLQALGLLLVVQDGRFDNNVLPQRIITQLIPAGTLLSQGQVVEVIVSRGREKVKAPPVVGLTVQEAQNRLSSLGLAIERRDAPSTQSPAGVVLSQDPVAETEVEWGGVVRVVVSIGDRVAVPSLVGKTEAEAQRLIEQAGLSTTFPNYQSADDVPTQLRAAFNSIPDGSVVSSDPAAGIFLARGDIVKIAVRNR
jgi:serine/threonine-protein kinase